MERTEAVALLARYVHDKNLTRHCLATGAVMKKAAEFLSEDAVTWETIGILHDIDFELIGGDMGRHGTEGAEILIREGIDRELAEIIQRHNHFIYRGTYERPVEIVLQAADSVSGLVFACALVKGGKISDVTPKTVGKKMKEKGFAAGCDRDRIGLIRAVMDPAVFYELAIQGLLEIRSELDLT